MQKFKDITFYGFETDYNKNVKKLIKRLKDGLSILSGLSQPSHSPNEKVARENEEFNKGQAKELDDVVRDIADALGREIIFKRKDNK